MTTPEAVVWKLNDLYESYTDPRLADDMARAKRLAQQFSKVYRGRAGELSASDLAQAIGELEQLMDVAYRPQLYASLAFAADTESEVIQDLFNRTQENTTEVFNELKFFDIELKTLFSQRSPEAEVKSATLFKAPELKNYWHYLTLLRQHAPHTLSEGEERIAELKNLTGRIAFDQLYTEVTSRMKIPIEIEDQKRDVSVAEARALRSSPDRETRNRAVEGLLGTFEQHSHVLNFCFNTLLQDHRLETEARHFSNVAEPTFLDDELSPDIVERLLSSTEHHYSLAQRYMQQKARALALPDFASHDLLAPLLKDERKVPFEEAKKMVIDAFRSFDPHFERIAREFFENQWIDVPPRVGKRDGAFCSGMLPSLHPYVLINYNERIDDVSTLAHELGHGIHFYLSRKQTPLNFWATTPLAETASVFAELVLMRRLLDQERDPLVRRNLLAHRIEDIIATVFNQVQYTRWEQRAHEKRREGVVPAEEYAKLWMEERHRLYGTSVRFLPRDRWGWISIGHFIHFRFYCYSYAFGQLLVLALFKQYETEGSQFVPKYIELLSSGSSDTPQTLLSKVGIDIREPNFWSGGFKILESLIDEFERSLN